jgi:hypothetical protein
VASGAVSKAEACKRKRTIRRADSQEERGPAYQFCVRENRKSNQRLARGDSKGERPGPELPHAPHARRHIAEGHHAPAYSRCTRLIAIKDTKTLGSHNSSEQRPRVGDSLATL